MQIESEMNCPMDGFNPCRKLKCGWFIKMRGTNPNTGEDIDEWGCTMAWLPVLLVENSQMQRQTGAAVESFRNETCKANEMQLAILASTALPQLPKGE